MFLLYDLTEYKTDTEQRLLWLSLRKLGNWKQERHTTHVQLFTTKLWNRSGDPAMPLKDEQWSLWLRLRLWNDFSGYMYTI